MADLYNYEVTDQQTGAISTMQLSEDDAKRFPNARKLGPASTSKTEAAQSEAAQSSEQPKSDGKPSPGPGPTDVKNRARGR